jgi:hypothetical protein
MAHWGGGGHSNYSTPLFWAEIMYISKLSINFSTLQLFSLVASNKAKKVKK